MGSGPRLSQNDWRDVALAVGALAISGSTLVGSPGWDAGPIAWILVLIHVAPIAFRRRAPSASFAVSLVAGAAYLAGGWPMVGLGLAALLMIYSLAAYAPVVHSVIGLLAAEAGLALESFLDEGSAQVDTLIGNLLVLAAAWFMGYGARHRRLTALAEQQRLARQAVSDERLRIARELHDVVAHSMSVIAVQAGTGRMVIDDDPAHARRALASIEETSQQALREMRRLLGVLRTDTTESAAELAPMPTLADLDLLVAQTVDGGTPVELSVEGDRGTAPASIELAAYRVVQEALTNVRRHAAGTVAHVRVAFEPAELVIEVRNRLVDDHDAQPAGGHGLLGMRERVTLYGGTFEAGPRADGTFMVTARIPYDPAARAGGPRNDLEVG